MILVNSERVLMRGRFCAKILMLIKACMVFVKGTCHDCHFADYATYHDDFFPELYLLSVSLCYSVIVGF